LYYCNFHKIEYVGKNKKIKKENINYILKKLFRYTSEPVSNTIPNITNNPPEILSIHNIFDLIFVKNTRNRSMAIAEIKNGIANPNE
jgi:hypothetical protein